MTYQDAPALTVMGERAAQYASRYGWHVFPLKPGSKVPHGDLVPNGQDDASNDPDTVRRWWAACPEANIGLNLAASGLVALDPDLYKPECGWSEFVADKTLPDTLVQASARGGKHYIYTAEPGAEFRGKLCDGVEIKHKGYIVLAPSRFEGLPYTFETRHPPAPVPAWVPRKGQRPKLSERAAPIDTGATFTSGDGPSQDEVADALSYIDPDLEYSEWLSVLMAIHDEFGTAGLSLADDWSARGNKYQPGLVAEKFKGFQPGGGVSIKHVFHLAKQNGADLGALARKHRGQTISPAKAMAKTLNLVTDKADRPYWNTANAVEILSHHPAWAGVLGFNEFTRRRVVLKPIPGTKTGHGRNLEDDDATAVLSWFNRNGFPKATATVAVAAVHAVARRNSFDPLQDYLKSLTWDGTPRISEWLATYCGAESTDYTREAGRRWLISAIARAFKPGCKADHMLVLEGEQGARKSSALAALAGPEWFSDALPPMNTKDASSYLRGRWIVEVAELEAMRREMDAVKAFISRQVESYRPAYGREEVDEPRRCIFAGTTNKDAWLRDETGGRRFWPVRVGTIDLDAIKRDRGQLWAEAVAAYRTGEDWWMQGDVEAEARKQQGARMADDPWTEDVAAATEGRTEISIREVLGNIGIMPSELKREHSDRVAGLLKRQGWQRQGRVTSGLHKGQARYIAPE